METSVPGKSLTVCWASLRETPAAGCSLGWPARATCPPLASELSFGPAVLRSPSHHAWCSQECSHSHPVCMGGRRGSRGPQDKEGIPGAPLTQEPGPRVRQVECPQGSEATGRCGPWGRWGAKCPLSPAAALWSCGGGGRSADRSEEPALPCLQGELMFLRVKTPIWLTFASYSHSKKYHGGSDEAAGWIWTTVIWWGWWPGCPPSPQVGSGSGELAYDFRGSGALICAREGSRLHLAAGSKGEVALALVAQCPGRQGHDAGQLCIRVLG